MAPMQITQCAPRRSAIRPARGAPTTPMAPTMPNSPAASAPIENGRSCRRHVTPEAPVTIAGIRNGAGKTTFAREYLLHDARILRFVNADLMAAGLSPLASQRAALAAARVMLAEIDRLAEQRVDFAFESDLSGRTYLSRLDRLAKSGYHFEVIFLRVASPRLALQRIAARVKQGDMRCPRPTSSGNTSAAGRSLKRSTDPWRMPGRCTTIPRRNPCSSNEVLKKWLAKTRARKRDKRIENGFLRAAATARKTARIYGTPIYVWENGKVVAKRP
jgi:hypothetical protein